MGNIQHSNIKAVYMNSWCRYTAISKSSLTDPVVYFAACSLWQGQCENIRSKDNLFARMPYHYFPGSLLCFREFWRGQRKNEVNYFPWLKNLIFSSLTVGRKKKKKEVNFLFFFFQGLCQINQSSLLCVFQSIYTKHWDSEGYQEYRKCCPGPPQWPKHCMWCFK